jgi:hypothetical protein
MRPGVIARGVGAMVLVAALASAGCVGRRPGVGTVEPIRASEMLDSPDPARRASTRLVIQGLDADASFDPVRARGSYERAIQVDPTNPMAYLALARHDIDAMEGQRALQLLEQAAALFEAEGLRVDRVGVQLMGLRGRAFEIVGEDGGPELVDRAAALAPEVWGDGDLTPEELR